MKISQNMSVNYSVKNVYELSTKKLVIASFLAAFSIILTRFVSIMLAGGTIRLGFGNVPVILSGILLGPLAGGLTGAVSDLIGILIMPQGSFHPGFTLSAALTGAIPGIISLLFPKSRFSLFSIILSNALVYVIISLGLNSFWLSQLVGRAFTVLVAGRALAQGIVSVISVVIIYTLCQSIKHWKID